MRSGEIHVSVSYSQIGDTHVLFHCYGGRLVNMWLLVDLEERARQSGKTVEQLLANLRKNIYKER